MNTNKREEKKCGEACLSHYGPVALYQYEKGDKTFWLCNAALFEELGRGEKVMPALPQNGDREKERKCVVCGKRFETTNDLVSCEAHSFGETACDPCLESHQKGSHICRCGCHDEPSAEGGNSEGKEKEPRIEWKWVDEGVDEEGEYMPAGFQVVVSWNEGDRIKRIPVFIKAPQGTKEKEPKEACIGCDVEKAGGIVPWSELHTHSALAEKEEPKDWGGIKYVETEHSEKDINNAIKELKRQDKEEPPKEWEERFEEEMPDLMTSTKVEPRELNEYKVKTFIQTLLKEKDEEFVKELEILEGLIKMSPKYSPAEGNKETTKQ